MTASGKPARIIEALFGRVEGLADVTGLPISWPEPKAAFFRPADGKYLAVSFFPNRPAWEGLASGRLDQGLLQITVVWPKNMGLIAPSDVAAQVAAHFPKNLRLMSGSTRVKIAREAVIGADLPEADSVSIPVTISWQA